MPVTHTIPQISGHDMSRSWFVYFDMRNDQTGETKRLQKRGRINHYQTVEERKAEAEKYLRFWKQRLKAGWHPFADSQSKLVNRFTPLHNALDFAFSKCDVSSATKKGYRGTIKFVQEAVERLGLKNYPIGDVEHQHILLILEEIEQKRDWSHHAYNKHAGYLCSILSRLTKWKAIKENPAEGIEMKDVVETKKFMPYTEEEKKKIREHLFIHHYRFFVYLMVLYHTGIRPKEILCLKIKDVDLENELITIYPDLQEENSKTKKIRYVPICGELLSFLKQLDLGAHDKGCYLFGSPFESGNGNRGRCKQGRGATHPEYFKPSLVHIKRDTVTKLWKKVVIDKLKINKHLYAAKHSGCDEKIMAGIDLDALREMYGHSSKFMTEKYSSVLQQLRFKEIKEKSTSF